VTRKVGNRLYPDFGESGAFALVDHEVAHVYVKSPGLVGAAQRTLEATQGVGSVLDRAAQKAAGLDHERSGDLVLTALPAPLETRNPPVVWKATGPDSLTIVLISDTHELHREVEVPPGDILIHAGDFTMNSKSAEKLLDFNE